MSSITVGTLTSTTVNVSGNITMTNGMVLPSFTTSGRPGSPTAGQMIFNTTISDVEVWTGSAWKPFLGQGLRNWTDSTRPTSPVNGDVGWNTEQEIAELYIAADAEWVPVGSSAGADPGEVLFVSVGQHSWQVPDGVEAVSVVAIGGGGGGSGDHDGGGGTGGGLGWRNNITVTPGTSITVRVGQGGPGGNESTNGTAGNESWFQSTGQVRGGGGTGGRGNYSGESLPGGNYTGAGGGRGGDNNYGSTWRNGGTGAGGYTGRGGEAAIPYNNPGQPGTGGGGGSGAGGNNYFMGGGGGTGVYGQGPNGSGGPFGANPARPGNGGSGGQPGYNQPAPRGNTRGNGGIYGGAGGGTYYGNNQGGIGANGAVRVIWGNDTLPRTFPNTNTSQGTSITVQQV